MKNLSSNRIPSPPVRSRFPSSPLLFLCPLLISSPLSLSLFRSRRPTPFHLTPDPEREKGRKQRQQGRKETKRKETKEREDGASVIGYRLVRDCFGLGLVSVLFFLFFCFFVFGSTEFYRV